MKKPIALFSGDEALFYPDVARVLEVAHRKFEYIDKRELGRELSNFSILIVPGGYTLKLLENLDEGSRESIRSFVENGGGYVGICMGVYVASEIGLVKSSTIRVIGLFDVELNIVQSSHPVMKGYTGKVKMNYQNGPEIVATGGDIPLAVFSNQRAAIIASSLGAGKIVLFSPHPERSRSSWGMIENALDYSES